jgi:hypothetical protein
MKIIFKILTLLVLNSYTFFGQERSISKKNVSMTVKNFILKNYPTSKRLKYYKEQEKGNTFVECEFKLDKIEYSIKFLDDSLIETEISMEFNAIPTREKQTIKSSLDSLFIKYKVLECQEVNPSTNPLFEINIKTKSGNYFELYYDKSGRLVNKTEQFIKSIPSQFK